MAKPFLIGLQQCDANKLESLLDLAFGKDRKNRTAYKLRCGSQQIERLSFGLMDGSKLVGSIQCWPVSLSSSDGQAIPLILVGPVAVHPDRQDQGYGRRMMLTILSEALEMGDPPMFLIGDADYYGLFGFSADETAGWQLPGPFKADRLLARNPQQHLLPKSGMLGPGSQKY